MLVCVRERSSRACTRDCPPTFTHKPQFGHTHTGHIVWRTDSSLFGAKEIALLQDELGAEKEVSERYRVAFHTSLEEFQVERETLDGANRDLKGGTCQDSAHYP